MNRYSGPVEVFANGEWHTARADLSGTLTRDQIRTLRGRKVVDSLEDWGGYIAVENDDIARQIYDDEGRTLRLPNGQERGFLAGYPWSPMNITGNGTIPFG
ncbi:hypothetical protein AB0C13_22250 [Streptomyces sp. NPDC049099]|uniref:hypothetical protein n=1 Tax=Streptomyces sp. NPDC049099 TaxID=3155768 RepID=UPI0034391550